MDKDLQEALTRAALESQRNAYARYSNFPVGAALLGRSGEIYVGANVENASLGLTICAERSAMAAAVVAGERSFEALAVATRGGAAPCGACRQFLAEFCDQLPVLLVDTSRGDAIQTTDLSVLLPLQTRFTDAWQ